MKIQIKKGLFNQVTLTITRDDGTSDWTKLHPNMYAHDIGHYVIETVLEFSKAFYGLINEGYNIKDFELPKPERPPALQPVNLPIEALQTEFIVNQIQVERFNSGKDPNFLETLRAALLMKELPFPEKLTSEKLDEIRLKYDQLITAFHQLPENDILELEIKF